MKVLTTLRFVSVASVLFAGLPAAVDARGDEPPQRTATLPNTLSLVDTISNLGFNPKNDLTAAHYGVVFNRCPKSVFDTVIQNYSQRKDYTNVIRTKRISELNGYESTIIGQHLKDALSKMEMLGFLPNTHTPSGRKQGVFLVCDRYMLHAYRYAKEMNHETEKWNEQKACQDFFRCFEKNSREAFLGCDPTIDSVWQPSFRYYDENMETLDVFLKFAVLFGQKQHLETAFLIWDTVNDLHWGGDHYWYTPSAKIYECETGFFILSAYLNNMTGFKLRNFDRALTDIYARLLKDQWNSPNWRDYVSRHADSNKQKRLHNTLISFCVLHTYYPLFPEQTKSAFRKLLAGGKVKAWEGLIDSSGLYLNHQFRNNDTYGSTTVSDYATSIGSMLLFLQGITPISGSLAIPLIEEKYEDEIGGLISTHFQMDTDKHFIRIPAWKGTIQFQFGTKPILVDLSDDGIYQIAFSKDWNSVEETEKVGELSKTGYRYISKVPR